MHTPPAAYLRVYEPLAAFAEDRAEFWREYAASGKAVSPLDGPAIQRDLLYQTVGPNWDDLPDPPSEAYVIESESGPLICPWQLGPRMAEAVRDIEDMVPPHLIEAFVSPRLAAEAVTGEVEPDPDAASVVSQGPHWHEDISPWHVPTRWFVCLEGAERELSLVDDERLLRYRIPMSRARRRSRHAYGILQTSLGRGNPVAVGIRQLSEWLSVFHPRSVVEVDYGGLVRILSDTELRDDDSPQLVHDGLTALARGDVSVAGRNYERLMRRWRQVRLRERSN